MATGTLRVPKTIRVNTTSDNLGNAMITGIKYQACAFKLDSDSYDGVYTPFFSVNGNWYVHVADWSGVFKSGVAVKGYAVVI